MVDIVRKTIIIISDLYNIIFYEFRQVHFSILVTLPIIAIIIKIITKI